MKESLLCRDCHRKWAIISFNGSHRRETERRRDRERSIFLLFFSCRSRSSSAFAERTDRELTNPESIRRMFFAVDSDWSNEHNKPCRVCVSRIDGVVPTRETSTERERTHGLTGPKDESIICNVLTVEEREENKVKMQHVSLSRAISRSVWIWIELRQNNWRNSSAQDSHWHWSMSWFACARRQQETYPIEWKRSDDGIDEDLSSCCVLRCLCRERISVQCLSGRSIVIDLVVVVDGRQNGKEKCELNVDWLEKTRKRTREEQEDDRCLSAEDQSMNNKDESLIFVSRMKFYWQMFLWSVLFTLWTSKISLITSL